jgi:ABC-type bacteriocin/lantibiotic exporters, contain an N-terminal double-glycine peptidase domain
VITRGTQTLSSLKSIDRIMSLERERSPERAYVSRKIEEGRIAFENVSFAYPGAPGNALEKVSFKIEVVNGSASSDGSDRARLRSGVCCLASMKPRKAAF